MSTGASAKISSATQNFGARANAAASGFTQRVSAFGQRFRASVSTGAAAFNLQKAIKVIIVLAIIGIIIYAIIEWRKFSNSPFGKALGKILGTAAAALAWMANHPFLSLFGIIGIAIFGPIVTAFASGQLKKIKDKLRDPMKAEREGKLDDNSPEAVEAATANITDSVLDEVKDEGSPINQQAANEASQRAKDTVADAKAEMKAEGESDTDINDDIEAAENNMGE